MYRYGTSPFHEFLDIPVIRDRVSLGVFHPRRQNVQETRSNCISHHVRFGGSNGLEDRSYGARRWLCNYGQWCIASTDNAISERCIAGTDNAVSERCITGTDNTVSERCVTGANNALLIAAQSLG